MVSLPDGHTFPVRMSATVLPPSSPGCHAMSMASTRSRHDTVSTTEPELRITITGLPARRKASLTRNIMSRSRSVRLNSVFMSSRSMPSPACRPMVMMAASASGQVSLMQRCEISISGSFTLPNCGIWNHLVGSLSASNFTLAYSTYF